MPRTSEQFKQMKVERRDSILESALVLYSLYGDKITIDQIADKAKCSHGIVYHYFKNVDEIIAKLLNSKFYIELNKSLNKSYANIKAENAIKSIVLTLLNLKTTKEIAYGNILISERNKKSLYNNLCNLVLRGQKEGVITGGNPVDIVETFFFTLKGIYLNSLLKKTVDNFRPSFDNVYEIFRKRV